MFGVKVVFFGFMVVGFGMMWMVVFVDVGVSLIVVVNGLWLLLFFGVFGGVWV